MTNFATISTSDLLIAYADLDKKISHHRNEFNKAEQGGHKEYAAILNRVVPNMIAEQLMIEGEIKKRFKS